MIQPITKSLPKHGHSPQNGGFATAIGAGKQYPGLNFSRPVIAHGKGLFAQWANIEKMDALDLHGWPCSIPREEKCFRRSVTWRRMTS